MLTRRFLQVAAAAGALLSGAQTGLAQSDIEAAGESRSKPELQGDIFMTHATTSSTLKVPGAEIYYEKLGSGPLLLVIPGGAQDAGVFAEVSRHLADRYTVVAYDPRGNSRSPFDGEPEALSLDVQADDAAALINSLGGGPAYVFGTSGGAQIGLNLAARYPDRVRALVAHEPPTIMLLDDPSDALAADKAIHDTYRREGVDAAMAKILCDERPRGRSGAGRRTAGIRHAARGRRDLCPGQRQFRVLARARHDASLALPSRRRRLAQGQTPHRGGHRRTVRRAAHP